MIMATLFLFLAQTPAPSPAPAGSGLLGMLPFVFLIVIMYYVMIRPQMRRQKDQAKLVSALKTGDRVVTASGIHGLISNVKETTVIVKVADNVKLEMEKSAVTNVVKSTEA
jgi:preprotein translocase subunit YajC